MPHSATTFDHILQDHVRNINPTSILDVGAGAGKNGRLIREMGYKGTLECLEPTKEYIQNYNLKNLYDVVHEANIDTFMDTQFKFQYDLVIFGDVLEHLFHSRVIDVLDYFLYKSKWIIIIWPTNMPQDDWGNNPYEIHKSNFKIADLAQKFDVQFYLKNFLSYLNNNSNHNAQCIHYTVLKGYTTTIHQSLYNFNTGFSG
jgi:SAM-dependent methyltransferase